MSVPARHAESHPIDDDVFYRPPDRWRIVGVTDDGDRKDVR
jgi:hypothetical protein